MNLVEPSNHVEQHQKYGLCTDSSLMNFEISKFYKRRRNISNLIRMTSNFAHKSYSTYGPTPTSGIGIRLRYQNFHYRSKSPKI